MGFKGLLIGITIICAFVSGYGYGRSAAANKYKAVLAQQAAEYAKKEQGRFQALAEAERESRLRFQKETEKGRLLAKQFNETKQKLEKERLQAKGKVHDASQNASGYCSGMPPDWVQSYNQALGLAADSSTLRLDANTSGASSSAGAAGTSAAGIRQVNADASLSKAKKRGAEVFGFIDNKNASQSSDLPPELLASPKDILVHLQQYGAYCQRMELQLKTLIRLLEKKE